MPRHSLARQRNKVPAAWSILRRLLSRAAWWARKGDAHLDLVLANKEELVRDVIISVSLAGVTRK